jgi:hypothetical protein
MRGWFVILAALLVLVAVGGFYYLHGHTAVPRAAPLTVSELLQHGPDYQGRVVSVSGIVVTGASVLGLGGYRLRDTNSQFEIFVFSDTGIPATNQESSVTGIFKQGITMGDFRNGVIIPQTWCDAAKARNTTTRAMSVLCQAV